MRPVASDKWIDEVIFGGLLAVIALAAIPWGLVEPCLESLFEHIIFIIAVCWCVSIAIDKSWRLNQMLLPLAGLALFACLQTLPLLGAKVDPDLGIRSSSALSADPSGTKHFAFRIVAFGLVLAMLLHYTSNKRRLVTVARLVIFVGVASAVFAICQWLAPSPQFTSFWDNKLPGESFGQFMNRNHFALLMGMSLGPALGLALYTSSRALAFLYLMVAVLMCVALVLTKSRGGIISMFGQFAFFSWTWFGRNPRASRGQASYKHRRLWPTGEALARRIVLTVLLLGIAVWGVLWLGGDPVLHRLESVPDEFIRRDYQGSIPRRLEIWTATGKLIADHPIFGSGLGAYNTAIVNYFPPSESWLPEQAHNEYLELIAGGGVIAAALGIWFVLVVVREARKRFKDGDAALQAARLGAMVGLAGVAIHSLVDFGLHVTINALVCCSLIAIATSIVQPASGSALNP